MEFCRILYNPELRFKITELLPVRDDTNPRDLRQLIRRVDDNIYEYIKTLLYESEDIEYKKKHNCKLIVPTYIKHDLITFNCFEKNEMLVYKMLDFAYYNTLDAKSLNEKNIRKVFTTIDSKSGLNRSISGNRSVLIRQKIITFIYNLATVIKHRLIYIYAGEPSIEYIEMSFHILFSGNIVDLFTNNIVPSSFIKPKSLFDEIYGTN